MKVSEASLDWALKHVERYGDTDIFPVPFEFEAIRHDWPNVKRFLASADLDVWEPRPYRRCLSPKHRYGFRVSTQLDPLDTLLFTAVVFDLGAEIEKARIPAAKKIVVSHRFKPGKDGRLYDPRHTYESFQTRSATLAASKTCRWVVVADIADFYPRLYLHPLENALAACTEKVEHVRALKRLLSGWNFTISYGLPVGPAVSRLLAEVAVDDVDRALQSEGATFCRYSDDYRIFCRSRREAHEKLAFLANTLFENHGLTLQQHKTRILSTSRFLDKYVALERFHEAESLSKRFSDILEELEIDDRYGEIDYDSLSDDVRDRIDAMNLQEILEEQVGRKRSIDMQIVRFVLRRLGQIDNTACVDVVMKNVEKLYPVFPEILRYLRALRSLEPSTKRTLGKQLIQLLRRTIVGHLEFHRGWVFDVFATDTGWDNAKTFSTMYTRYPDEFSRRALVLALGRAKQVHWFKSRKRSVHGMSPWEKRAFLAAASCLPGDEAEHWYRSIKRGLDVLETAVVSWAKARPFG